MHRQGKLRSEQVHCVIQKRSACVHRVHTGRQIGLLLLECGELRVRRDHFAVKVGVIICDLTEKPLQLLPPGLVRWVRAHSA
jgi:hypothetical protein